MLLFGKSKLKLLHNLGLHTPLELCCSEANNLEKNPFKHFRSRSWLVPAFIAAILFIGNLANNLVATDLGIIFKSYQPLVWLTFFVALIIAVRGAIGVPQNSSKPSEIIPPTKGPIGILIAFQ